MDRPRDARPLARGRAHLPRFDELRREVAAWELARRPAASSLAPRAARVEALVQSTLAGEAPAYDDLGAVRAAAESFLRALPTGRVTPVAPLASWGALLPRAAALGRRERHVGARERAPQRD